MLPVLEEIIIVSFAGDLALVFTAKDAAGGEVSVTELVRAVKIWLASAGLTLADENTKEILIIKRRKRSIVQMNFREHLENAYQKQLLPPQRL